MRLGSPSVSRISGAYSYQWEPMSGKKGKGKSQNFQPKSKRQSNSKRVRKTTTTKQILAPFAKNPMRPQRTKISRDGSSCRIRGTDFLTAVTISGTAATAGDVLISQIVNPAQLGVARLATMAKLYERYKFKSLKFRYSPVANATISGQVIGYVDYDTYDDPTGSSGTQNLQRAAAHYGEKPVQIWQGSEKPVFWEIKDVDPLTDLYIDSDGSDPRWTNQGRFILLAASAIAANTPCGNVYLDYDIEFYIPQIEVTPSVGYASKFTGSTSCTTSAILGTAIAGSTWNNLPLSAKPTGNTFTVHPGSYLITLEVHGTTISATRLAAASGVEVNSVADCLFSTSIGLAQLQLDTSTTSVVTLSASAAAISTSTLYVTLLNRNASTVNARKLALMERMYKSLTTDTSTLRVSEFDSKEVKTKEDKEQELGSKLLCSMVAEKPPLTRFVSNMSSSSTSSSSSSSFGSQNFRDSLDEQYVRIRKS